MLEFITMLRLREEDVPKDIKDPFVAQFEQTSTRIKKFLVDLVNEYEPETSN